MNKSIELKAYGKLNLSLDILGKRKDGFHNVSMIMHSISLCDNIKITLTDGGDIKLFGDVYGISNYEDNLIYKAAKLIKEKYVPSLNCNIEFKKNIPVMAGLAGGSSDAGHTLLGLNKLLNLNLSLEELLVLGGSLGSDVPFTIFHKPALATGRGERLMPITSNLEADVILIKPKNIFISTPWAYNLYTKYKNDIKLSNEDELLYGLFNNDLALVNKNLNNSFQYIMEKEIKEIAYIIEELKNMGLHPLMSGSGPSIFALIPKDNSILNIKDKIESIFKDKIELDIFTTRLINN